ncbi:MAG: hypothetical protein ACK5KO_07820 [Arachnia sp.]
MNLKNPVRVSIATALVVAGASFALPASAADVAATLSTDTAYPGSEITMTVTACEAPDSVYYTIGTSEGIYSFNTVAADASGTTVVTFDAPVIRGVQDVTVSIDCIDYETGDAVTGDPVTFTVDYNIVEFSPTSWEAGDSVNLTAFGYTPGESVTLTMTDKSTGEVVWTYDAGVAAADGSINLDVVLKSDVPQGTYILALTGDDSGRTTSSEFYWGSPDADDDDAAASDTPAATAGSNGTVTVGLPTTGV